MKFGEELDRELIPEWRSSYVNYKIGKRHVKAISKAVHRTTRSAQTPAKHNLPFRNPAQSRRDNPHRAGRDEGKQGALDIVPEHNERDSTTNSKNSTEHRDHSSSRSSRLTHLNSGNPIPRKINAREELLSSLKPLAIPANTSSGTHGKKARFVSPPTALESATRGTFKRAYTFARSHTIGLDHDIHPSDAFHHRDEAFRNFLHTELEKVESFYAHKEKDAAGRLAALRKQMHVMRQEKTKSSKRSKPERLRDTEGEEDTSRRIRWSLPSTSITRSDRKSTVPNEPSFTPITAYMPQDANRDFTRKRSTQDVSQRTARHKLKVAVQEFYRSLALLKLYALLNRTAFRKLNKKYDKAIQLDSMPKLQFLKERVDKSDFVKSDKVNELIETTEDLYTRYFEHGNRKLAVEKLHSLTRPRGDRSESAFINGGLLGIGLTFAVEGVVLGFKQLNHEDAEIRTQTSFLLQIYGGYFLMLYLFAWYCINCRLWTHAKVNYAFIFEFDPKHDLDWRQLSVFPSFFTLLFGLFIWLNFADIGAGVLFEWYPVMLIGITAIITFMPFKIFRHKSRRWFVYSHMRLFLAGVFPVEFRDFFLGDMYCSLTYAVANAEVFFCLYITSWNEPARCDSKHSRLLGALIAVPPLWRALQCIRRYWDSKHSFPHLANLLKYVIVIMAAVGISLYRMDPSPMNFALFISFSSINSFYSAAWDIFMDFSLLQAGAKKSGLRDTMAFKQAWMYYGILIFDPILRFGWIPLAIFIHNVQHGSVVAFIVAFTEVTRRALWSIFRVENEHCSNIKSQKAIRDVPLPYKLTSEKQSDEEDAEDEKSPLQSRRGDATPLIEAGHVSQRSHTHLRRRTTIKGFSRMLSQAHRQDFQRRKPMVEDQPMVADRGIQQALQSDEGSDGSEDKANQSDTSRYSQSSREDVEEDLTDEADMGRALSRPSRTHYSTDT